MAWLSVIFLVLGFVFLSHSAAEAIRRVVKISRLMGVSEAAVSFAIVGTMAILPEFSIGINSALGGNSSLGLGLVFGSNIADLTLVIGLVALASREISLKKAVIEHSNLLLALAIMPVVFLFDGEISRPEGFLLVASFFLYTFYILKTKNGHSNTFFSSASKNLVIDFIVLAGAVAVLLVSGHFIAQAASEISLFLAIPVFFVGIVLAIGTCLPELTLAMQASNKHHAELGLGDILGNVFADCTLTLGVIAMISPIKPGFTLLALASGVFMALALLVVLALFKDRQTISRKEGMMLIILYIVFLASQFLLEKVFA